VDHQLKLLERSIQETLRLEATQPHVYTKDIGELEILVAPIEEQRRSAAVLDAA